VCKRTQAKQRSERESGEAPRPSVEDSRQVVDVIRKNSTARQHGPGSGAGTPVLPPVTEQQQQQPPPPVMYAMSPQVLQTPAQAPPPQRQFPNQHRYTLVDPGANSAGSVAAPPERSRQVTHGQLDVRPVNVRGVCRLPCCLWAGQIWKGLGRHSPRHSVQLARTRRHLQRWVFRVSSSRKRSV
jgi:hypothetical protein